MSRSNNQVHIDEINESVTENIQKSFMFIVFCISLVYYISMQYWVTTAFDREKYGG